MLQQLLVFLGVAIVTVPLFKRLGLGSVLGYLIAGLLIGPSIFGLISNVEDVLHSAEFGVVLLLFIIGLELEPSRLWKMRSAVFGVGGLQLGATSVLLMIPLLGFGLSLPAALISAVALALSSTAICLQLLTERDDLTKPVGRTAFGILLFQDLAAIPVLAAMPLFAVRGGAVEHASSGVFGYFKPLVVIAVIVAARFVTRPLLNFVARTRIQELFTATALFAVVGSAYLAELAGLSMALGAFVAGVLLADSEYRHELEADIEPFKGLLLGLFFIAVGMSLNVPLILAKPFAVVGAAVGVMLLKGLVLFAIGWFRPGGRENAATLAVAVSQVGEFAFVLFGQAAMLGVMEKGEADFLIAVTGMSMGMSPLLVAAYEKFLRPHLAKKAVRPYDVNVEEDAPVIIAGFGRVGQVVARVLRAKRIPFIALDASSEHIEFLRKFGNTVFFGDASRVELLRAARAERAKILVVAIDDMEASLRTVASVQKHFPHLTIFARARNRQHAYRLLDLGVTRIMRETFAASLEMTRDVLVALGDTEGDALRTAEQFRVHDEELLNTSYKHAKDLNKLQDLATKARKELEELFEKDASERKAG